MANTLLSLTELNVANKAHQQQTNRVNITDNRHVLVITLTKIRIKLSCSSGCYYQCFIVEAMTSSFSQHESRTLKIIRHRASTSMYSLTFSVCFLLPECHQRKPAVQAAAVMLRTSPVDGQSPASQPRPLSTYGAQF